MGFIGSLRKIINSGKDASTGVIDVATVSKNIVREAEQLRLSELGNLFTTKFLKLDNGKAFLGASDLRSFVSYARRGDYINSFQTAFRNEKLLSTPAIQRSVRKVLGDAASELPDARILAATEQLRQTKSKYKLNSKTFNSADDMDNFVKSNPELSSSVNKVVKEAKRTGKLKMFGYTAAVTAASFTAYALYEFCVKEAARNTGCFLFTKTGDQIIKCKVGSLSCKYPVDGKLCNESDTSVIVTDNRTDCLDKNVDCENGKCNSDNYKNLKENQVLRCESKTAADILAESINSIGAGASSLITGAVGGILKWGLIILVVLAVVVVVFKFVIGPMISNLFVWNDR